MTRVRRMVGSLLAQTSESGPMTMDGASPEREEITVRFPEGVLGRVDESCRAEGYATRSEFVSDAIDQMVEGEG